MERVHYLRCPIKRRNFMDTAGYYDGHRFLGIDEMKTQFQFNGRQENESVDALDYFKQFGRIN